MMQSTVIGHSVGNSGSSEGYLIFPDCGPMPFSILLFGRDSILLQTRKWLLERCGYEVRTAEDIGQLKRIAEEGTVDLLLLCHSLLVEEAEEAIAAVSARQPQAKILLMLISGSRGTERLQVATVETHEGPAGLLSTVASLARATRSRGVDGAGNGLRSEPH